MWWEGIEERADALPCCLDGSFLGLSQQQFQFGEDLLNRIKIGRIGWQKQQLGSRCLDRVTNRLTFVTAKIIHDDDVAGRQCRREKLLDIGSKACPIDRTIKHAWCIDPIMAQRGKKRERAPLAKWGVGD